MLPLVPEPDKKILVSFLPDKIFLVTNTDSDLQSELGVKVIYVDEVLQTRVS